MNIGHTENDLCCSLVHVVLITVNRIKYQISSWSCVCIFIIIIIIIIIILIIIINIIVIVIVIVSITLIILIIYIYILYREAAYLHIIHPIPPNIGNHP